MTLSGDRRVDDGTTGFQGPAPTPVADPPPAPEAPAPFGSGVRTSSGALSRVLTDQHRQRVEAAVGFHLAGKLPGIQWTGAVKPLADRWFELFGTNEQAMAALEADVNSLFALTDTDIAERMVRGEPLGVFGDVFDAIAEVSWEIGAADLARRFNEEASGAVKGTFDSLSIEDATSLSTRLLTRGIELGEVESDSVGRFDPRTKSAVFQTLFDAPGAWSYAPDSNLLVVTVGEQTVGLEPRAGFDPTDHLDVLAEVVSAQADGRVKLGEITGGQGEGVVERMLGVAHRVGAAIESNDFSREFVDFLWNALEPGDLDRARADIRDSKGQLTEESVRLASMIPFPEDAMVASVARLWMGENPQLRSEDALARAATFVAENRDQFVSEFESLTAEEILTELEREAEGRSPIGVAVEESLTEVLNAMEWWDRFSQTVGVAVLDTFRDFILGVEELEGGNWEEGFDRFKAMFDVPTEMTTAAEYFGLEGEAADWANLTTGIVFDPLNFVAPGAKGVRAMARRALTNPDKFGRLYLRMGEFPSITKLISGATRIEGGEIVTITRLADEGAATVKTVQLPAGEVAEVRRVGPTKTVRVGGRVVTDRQAQAVRTIAGMSGLPDDAYVDLFRLAMDPHSTREQVEDVFIRAMKGDWLGEGPFRAVRHSTIEGIGKTLESIADGKISTEHADTLIRMLSRQNTGRTFRLGDNKALDEFMDLLVQLFPADADTFQKWALEALERRAAAADGVALSGAAAMSKEAARRRLHSLGGVSAAVRGRNDLAGISHNLATIEETLANFDRLGLSDDVAATVRDQLLRLHESLSARWEGVQPQITKLRERSAEARKKLKQATYLEADVANATRNTMAGIAYEVYEDVAKRINARFGDDTIPVIKGKSNPLAPDVPVRDWSRVTGVKRFIAGDDPDLALMMGLAVDDVDNARALDAVGMFNRSQHVLMPASPFEITLFEKLAHNETALANATRIIRNEFAKKVSRSMKMVFAFNLLLNPLTAGKVTLDETMRFFADTGEYLKFLEATAVGLPGVGGAVERGLKWTRGRWGEAMVNPYAAQYRRNVGAWFPDDFGTYQWVQRPPRRVGRGQFTRAQYREQVERWVNGTLLNDRRFQQWARWVDEAEVLADGTKIPPQGWVDWWESGSETTRPGKLEARTVKVTIRDKVKAGTELSATEAFNIIDRSVNYWLDAVVDARDGLRERLVKAATTPGDRLDLVKDARFLNAIERVPGLAGGEGVLNNIFHVMFGAPQGRRAGVFYEHYFDEAFALLKDRHADRLLTVDSLMEYAKVDRQTAEFWLRQGSDNKVVADLVRQQGMRTEAQLAAQAARYAERRADDLMFRFTATSMAGRGVESALMFPFARAQTDFLSWWWDHLTKPMQVRLPFEVRAKLPEFVNTALQGVESIPLNLRALGRYAHLASTVNNEHQSVFDQVVDTVSFFPLDFGEGFLIDVLPQPGPIPDWLFDIAIDKGLVPDEVVANIEAIYPALAYTEFDGDVAGDLFNRILPSSKRSVRDLTVGMMRAAYTIFGKDIHTDPGLIGQIAQWVGDGQLPKATGDFHAAAMTQFLNEKVWELVPGSDDWNRAVVEAAVKASVEANREEWSRDWRDRVFPLADESGEYRALDAFEYVMTDDQAFDAMATLGMFDTNDLLVDDESGLPRVRAIWEKRKRGEATADDLEWLQDRLVSAYFAAGDVEMLPGFSFLDWLNIASPGITVNLINKSEDSGIPVRSEEHAEFKARYINSLTGRLQNVPAGEEGRELITDARRRGWLVSRRTEDWVLDAGHAAYRSRQRAIRGVWEWVSHRTWAAGTKKSIEDKEFTLGAREAMVLTQAGFPAEAGQRWTYGEFYEELHDFDKQLRVGTPTFLDTMSRGVVFGALNRHDDMLGAGLIDMLDDADKFYRDQGIESIEDWPEEAKAEVRRHFSAAVDLGYISEKDYAQEMEGFFGPLNWEPPVPPKVEDLKTGIRVSGDQLADLDVVDGDTVAVWTADGPMRVRLIGINAPEVTQEGYAEAREQLARILEDADEVVFGVWKPELFGMSQLSAPGARRLLAWLYVDGVPVYDPSVFSASNPRGAGVGGRVVDLVALRDAEIERQRGQ